MGPDQHTRGLLVSVWTAVGTDAEGGMWGGVGPDQHARGLLVGGLTAQGGAFAVSKKAERRPLEWWCVSQ